jgi:microsomal dipeptidase-like Zn-dependent dipeptidase
MATYYSDLHCHSTLFNYNRQLPNAWDEHPNIIFPSQGDFAKLAKGKVRVVMVALYPIEQGFITVKPLELGTGEITDFLAGIVFHMPDERADEIQDDYHDYFDDLVKELIYLQASEYPVSHEILLKPGKRAYFKYLIARNFEDIKNILGLDADLNPGPPAEETIVVVITIEGGNSLGIGQKSTKSQQGATFLEDKVIGNISKLKKLGPAGHEGDWCPFFITLSHHFWNQLGGHAISLWKVIRKVLDQTEGLNEDISPLGIKAIEALLSKENGQRRILIDVTHMSIKARKWYFGYVEGKNIPIIASHTGANGKRTMAESEIRGECDKVHDIADKMYEESMYFNPWDQFLSNEEIIIIQKSGGIIGLNMDQRIMMGKEKLEETKEQVMGKPPKKSRKIWIRPLADQLLYIAGVILQGTRDPAKIWDNISIGSDFSGMITPIKAFDDATKFPDLDEALFNELISRRISDAKLADKTDAEIREITDKVVWKNNLMFLEKHFR